LLLLVRRGDAEVPLVLAASTWGVTAPPSEAPMASAPRPTIAPPAPPPLPEEVPVSLAEVLGRLDALAPAERPPPSLPAYSKDLERVRQEIETLAARRAAPTQAIDGLRGVLRYFDAAEVAWNAVETERDRRRLARHLPMPDETTAPYFEDSPAALVLEQFPFLRATVERDPSPGRFVESAGLWRPLQARTILWAHGREELARVEGRLDAGSR
jgi:hypothetical protein